MPDDLNPTGQPPAVPQVVTVTSGDATVSVPAVPAPVAVPVVQLPRDIHVIVGGQDVDVPLPADATKAGVLAWLVSPAMQKVWAVLFSVLMGMVTERCTQATHVVAPAPVAPAPVNP